MKQPLIDHALSDEVSKLRDQDFESVWDPERKPHVFRQYQNQLRFYVGLVKPEMHRIMDIGCASATLSLLLAERGHYVVAVDLREGFLEYARLRYTHGQIQFVQADALSQPLPTGMDLIFANQIIEHTVYPLKMLRNLARSLSNTGRIVVTTPNQKYFRNKLPSFTDLGDVSAFEDKQHTADGDGHFFLFREEELREQIEKAGLEIERVSYFETPIIAGHCKLRHLNKVIKSNQFWEKAESVLLSCVPLLPKICHQISIIARIPQ